ncbi:MAG TPA: phospho-N-acetylmuramoyl-pentapeptide-transferase [Dehalococcoidia bacterium]|nr:phospho-N-acetylmuramoyl-pentapeptide-transferase [Dehalococcoidia bacterium]
MFHALVVGVIAFVIATVAGSPVVELLQSWKLGKAISAEGPSTHNVKAGTPTMGGILIFGTVLVVTLLFNLVHELSILLPFTVIAVAGSIGFVDDLGSLNGRRQHGVSWRLKFGLLGVLSLASGIVLYRWLGVDHLHVPWVGYLRIGVWVVPLALLLMLATTTAVAITDGMDGLLATTAALAFGAYGIIAAVQEQTFLAAFCFTVVGAVLGFLWYNAYPARVFMGDTGALALGAALAIVAMMTEQWLVLPLVGIVFVVNGLSDVVQIGYFKLTHGRRVFRMTPLHHHFELLGWPEPRVVTRLWLVGAAGAMLGIAAALRG